MKDELAKRERVHSFTSALGEFVLIFGEAFGSGYGITAMRIASLVAAAAAVYYAYRICIHLRLHWSGQVLALGYLAADHLQIFFGMAGMETQLATALVLANVHYYLARQWRRLGVATGLAIICRPEFLLWPAVMAAALAAERKVRRPEVIGAVALPAALVSMPWIIFATFYYGSPVPHTVIVKSYLTSVVIQFVGIADYVRNGWQQIAPFKQYFAFAETPLPEIVLQATVGVVLVLTVAGAIHAVRTEPRMYAVLGFLVGFVVYRVVARVSPYFMWYLPPFTALLFLFAACGVSWMAQRQKLLGRSPDVCFCSSTRCTCRSHCLSTSAFTRVSKWM